MTIKTCKIPTKINFCQDKSSGGHQGTIFSITKTKCIKQLSTINNEIKFYEKHNELIKDNIILLKDYIPQYDGICTLNNKNYFIMQNLKSGFKQPLAIDIKIGYYTASKKILKNKKQSTLKIYSKLFKHYILDTVISTSRKYGFRIEGVALPSDIKLSKQEIMKLNYSKIFDYYFKNDIDNKALINFIEKLKIFYNVIKSKDFARYYFIGASILFTYDGMNSAHIPSMKLIDFENSLVLNKQLDITKNEKHAENNRKAIQSLITNLQSYLDKKITT